MVFRYILILLCLFLLNNSIIKAQNNLSGITSWAYQLQDINIQEIADDERFELVVIDYSSDGTDENKFSQSEINLIKNSGKKVISYLSIGEAETYRYYWQNKWDADKNGVPDASAPEWLGKENPDWEGNYEVKYWYPEWQEIVFSYIDKIIAQGFDGIYLDLVDNYYYWMETNPVEPKADSLMVEFIAAIREYVDSKTDGRFFIIPQNGEFIIYEPNVNEELYETYFSSIDAIGIEDVFFYGDKDENNSYNPDMERLNTLQEFLDQNKPVFSVEYLTREDLIEKYKEEAAFNQFIPLVCLRNLNTLGTPVVTEVENVEASAGQIEFVIWPNPFNAQTTIEYELEADAKVNVTVFDCMGQKISILANETQRKGKHSIGFDAKDLATGTYYIRLLKNNESGVKKIVVLK